MKAQTSWRSSFTVAALLSAGALAACSGKVGGPGISVPGTGNTNPGSGSGNATGTNPVGGGTGGSGVATGSGSGGSSVASMGSGGAVVISTAGANGAIPPESAGTLVMRRVTFREYDHMLADLLGDVTAPAEGGSWTNDTPNETGFVAPNNTPDLLVNLYSQTADTLVDNAVKAVAAGKTAGKFIIPCKTAPATPTAEKDCATQFITAFGLAAYRRPVAPAEQMDLLTLFSNVRTLGLSFNDSLGAIAKGMIQSPNFLYHWEIGPTKPTVGADGLVPLTSWQIASRLASSLWETMPDDALLTAAQAGQLSTPAGVTTQVTRMLADARAANALYTFHQQWLFSFGSGGRDLSQLPSKASPLFTPSVAQGGAQSEFTQFLASVYSTDGTLSALFTAPYTFVNHDLAAIYGVAGPATGFAKVSLDPKQRGGIFTQTAFLSMLANGDRDNPVYRGLSIYLKVLCGIIGQPPANAASNFMIMGTIRQSYEAHGAKLCAMACHGRFDPPGFAFENYDAIGAYRTLDAGQQVDSTGSFVTPGQATITFQNALDLSQQLAASPEAQACIDRQWTRYILGRTETTAEAGSMALAYQKGAATQGFSLRDMLATLASSKAFMYRQPSPGETL